MVKPLEDVVVERRADGVAVVSFHGEHDSFTKSAVSSLLKSLVKENDLVIADLSEAQFVDSSLLHTLVKTNKLARARGTSFRLRLGTPTVVKRAFEVSGVLEVNNDLQVDRDRRPALSERNESKGTSR